MIREIDRLMNDIIGLKFGTRFEISRESSWRNLRADQTWKRRAFNENRPVSGEPSKGALLNTGRQAKPKNKEEVVR